MRCFSFDIFDTCLTRLCGSPRNLFDVLSLSLRNSFGEVIDEVARKRFVALRSTAKGSNLREIYEDVFEKFSCSFSLEEMVQRELDLERQMILPIQSTKSLVDSFRKKGRILFISDMYLPSCFPERADPFPRSYLYSYCSYRTSRRCHLRYGIC